MSKRKKGKGKGKGKKKAVANVIGNKGPRVLCLGSGVSRQIVDAGGQYVYMSNSDGRAREAAAHDNIHAVVLTGGSDISPNIYGEAALRTTQSPDVSRDVVELEVLEVANRRDLPVLGICRGAQMLNAAFGGTLHQHIPSLPGVKEHCGTSHDVRTGNGTRLADLVGDVCEITSLHHQAVKDVAPGFVASSWSVRDGIIESIEAVDGFKMGVQFHPEIMTDEQTQKIFDGLVAAAGERFGIDVTVDVERNLAPVYMERGRIDFSDRTVKIPQARTSSSWMWGFDGDLDSGLDFEWDTDDVAIPIIPFCGQCGIRFDHRSDHIDHMFLIHGMLLEDVR
jgi:putative glutamine amidotransferase